MTTMVDVEGESQKDSPRRSTHSDDEAGVESARAHVATQRQHDADAQHPVVERPKNHKNLYYHTKPQHVPSQ